MVISQYLLYQSLLLTFQTMGNQPLASQTILQPKEDLIENINDANTTFDDDQSPYNNINQKNAKKEQTIKIRSLGVLKGSKQLQFGFKNASKRPSCHYRFRRTGSDEVSLNQNHSQTPLEPIVFSLIDFSVSQDLSVGASEQNRVELSSQQYEKIQSSTSEQENDGNNAQKEVLSYVLNFVEWTANMEVTKEQFIRIKKNNMENDYSLIQKVGQGSFGQVYRAMHKQTKQLRAVKLFKKNLLVNPKIKQQFLQEFSILKKVDHPHILKIFQIYEYKNSLSIVSQLCKGNSLASYIKKQIKFSSQTKMEILRQVFLGVNYLHHKNIIHRDLKPDNIVFITPLNESSTPEDVDIRIIDFGLAIEEKDSIFKDWANIGTFNFMAPQVFQGVYSNKCDSWACGIIMYVLLLGFNPFKGYQISQVKEKIKNYVPCIDTFKYLSSSATELILHLTKTNHILRWSIHEALNSRYFTSDQKQNDNSEVLRRISTYRSGNGLVSATQSYLSFKKTSQMEQSKVRKYFHSINMNRNGTINLHELQRYFEGGVQKQQIHRCFRRIDKNRSGKIDFEEFVVAMSNKKQLFTQQNLREVFSAMDVNKIGKITKEQLKHFLRSLDKQTMDNLINEISANKNSISFQQFSSYLLKDNIF